MNSSAEADEVDGDTHPDEEPKKDSLHAWSIVFPFRPH
jgi:hypothetical protein